MTKQQEGDRDYATNQASHALSLQGGCCCLPN